MADPRECPLCGGSMRLRNTETITNVPGQSQTITRIEREWVCPDCDYYEEVGEAGG